MKLLNSAITLGALTYVSQGLAIKGMINARSTEELSSLDSSLVSRASDSTTSHVTDIMNGAVAMARTAQDLGLHRWFAWYAVGLVDATADLVTDAMSDYADWHIEGARGTLEFIEDLTGDADQFITDAIRDAASWGEHFSESDFDKIANDLHSWVGDIGVILTEAVTEAADGSISFLGDVADDVGGWITEYAVDAADIFDGTYCFERDCHPDEQGLAQTEWEYMGIPLVFLMQEIRRALVHAYNNYGNNPEIVEP